MVLSQFILLLVVVSMVLIGTGVVVPVASVVSKNICLRIISAACALGSLGGVSTVLVTMHISVYFSNITPLRHIICQQAI